MVNDIAAARSPKQVDMSDSQSKSAISPVPQNRKRVVGVRSYAIALFLFVVNHSGCYKTHCLNDSCVFSHLKICYGTLALLHYLYYACFT